MRKGALLDILIIDDDIVDQAAIKRYLGNNLTGDSFRFHACGTGSEGLELIGSRTFGCIFLDYLLPDMNGIELLKIIYDAKKDLARAPIVMLTGKGSEVVMLDALRMGAQDYIVKDNISADSLMIALTKAQELFELKRSRYQAEEKLQRAQKMEAVGQLTSGVAHDFNNLLTVVLGNIFLIRQQIEESKGMVDPASLAAELDAIETVSRNGAELVKRLMTFSRQRPLSAQTVDINDCIRDACRLLKSSLGESIEIDAVLSQELPHISIDVSEFTNVLINIAVNARDAMPRGGTLTFETASIFLDEFYATLHPDVTPGPYVMVAISDTGTGMDQGTARRIFEPFFTTKSPGKGTGLGLSMVYGFVRQSNGHIDVYSEPDHGTVFRLYLPESSRVHDAAPAEASPGFKGAEFILVAENDDYVRVAAVNMLEKLGFKTLQAKDSKAALELFKREHKHIALIFADICMSGDLDGVELVKKAREYDPAVRAIFTSGYTEHTLRPNKLAVQDEFIGKPYHQNLLAKKICEALALGKHEHG